jgi:hypothetical protein
VTPLTLLIALSFAQDPTPAAEPTTEPAETPSEAESEPAETPAEAEAEPAAEETPASDTPQEPAVADEADDDDDEDEAAIEALEGRIASLETLVQTQSAELARQRIKLLPPDLTWDMEGHYRVRAKLFNNMFEDQGDPDGNYTDARVMEHRLRLRPVVRFKELASLHIEADLIENSFWGDNQSLASTSLFAADPTNTGFDGRPIGPVINRAWMEFSIPVGLIRVGRQASHWGMGLLANDGNGFDETFGENYGGNSFDRVIFATRPLAIAAAATGKEDKEIPLFLAVGVDRLVEEPLYEFYGYKCESGIPEGDPDYNPRCDPRGTGTTTEDHDYTDEERTVDDRSPSWWADQNDDVMEMIYVIIYRGEDVNYFGGQGDLTAGAYVIHRIQRETDSNVIIADAYLDAKVHGVHVEFEGVTIQGKTRAIALRGGDPSLDDPLAKRANIWGYVARAGYEQPGWKALMESGYASGDDNVADENFTGRPLHEDHNAGILLYEEVLARVTAATWTQDADALWSRGSVYNSHYVFPQASLYPLDNWELATGFLVAFPDKPDGVRILCAPGDSVDCAQSPATASTLGWELDFAVKHRWHEHLLFSLETGIARATDRVNLTAAGLNPAGNFFTVQSRIAWEF